MPYRRHHHHLHHHPRPIRPLTWFAIRWAVVFGLILASWPFGKAQAAVEHASPVIPVAFKKTLYTAHFEWKGSTYLFKIGTVERAPSEPGRSRFVAQIFRATGRSPAVSGPVLATCERQLSGEMPFEKDAILLRCQGELFAPAAAMTKFRFAPALKRPTLTFWTSARAAPHELPLNGIERGAPVNLAHVH